MNPLEENTDKFFWHQYDSFYEKHFPKDIHGNILEIGVLRGHSIRYLLKRFPSAKSVIGVDIIEEKKKWPKHSKIQYYMVDQSDENQINNFFTKNNNFDLIIEDGSHFPSHQERCFRLGFEAISNGGIYIVEDIHSCLPDHELFKKEQGYLENEFTPSLLTLLLVFERCKRKQKQITESDLKQLSKNKNFNSSTVNRLFNLIDEINIYKRVTFPDRCWNCGRENFSYANYKCFCNVELYKMADSMTTVIKKKK